MLTKQKKKSGLCNGLVHDVFTSIRSTFTATFLESTEEIAKKAVRQHTARKKETKNDRI